MTAGDVMLRLKQVFEEAGIQYMVTGSFASSHHSEPRLTNDIDLVIEATREQLEKLLRLLPDSRYYISRTAVEEAARNEGQFNVIDLDAGWKVDMILRKSQPHSIEAFQRRGSMDLDGVEVNVASAEDSLISKLAWAKLGESELQIRDAAAIVRIRRNDLDHDYIRRFVRELRLESQWAKACRMAGVEPTA
jgi:hypothetical protein